MLFLGEFAAIGASIAFSITSTLFTLSGRRYGAQLTMMGSLPIGFVCLMMTHWLILGSPLPFSEHPLRWIFMGLSGVVGFGFSAVTMMHAFLYIGPRLTLLIASLGPIMSAVLAWLLLDEQLSRNAIIGIALTISGIAFVVTENGDNSTSTVRATSASAFRAGIIFAILASAGQATSFILSKKGLTGDFASIYDYVGLLPLEIDIYHHAQNALDPLSASVIRILAGTIILWTVTAVRGKLRESITTLLMHRVALRQVSVAAVTGPVIGASLVLVGLANTSVGIATTLANLTPIFLIPISYVVFKEQISSRSIIGTLIAMCGIALIFT